MSEWTEALRARLADLRDAWRAIRRTSLQTATMIVSLAIGSTLTVLMFGVVDAMDRRGDARHARSRSGLSASASRFRVSAAPAARRWKSSG